MNGLARFVMAGRLQAMAAVVGFAAFSVLLPPVVLLSSAALALVTARLGASAGLTVLAGASVVIAVATLGLPGGMWIGALFATIQWVPVLVLALVLRYTVSLGATLVAALGLGLAGLVLISVLFPELDAYWRELLDAYLRGPMVEAGAPAEDVDQALTRAVRVMTASFITSLLFVYSISLFVARWWQALLYNPGGFGTEFRALRLGVPAAVVGLVLFAAAVLMRSDFATELAVVGLSLFFFQGLALIHALSGRTGNPMVWLVGAYIILVLALPQMLAALTALGVLDNFVDLRQRLGDRGSAA